MNNLTFNDIAMPMSFYEETGVWPSRQTLTKNSLPSFQKMFSSPTSTKFTLIMTFIMKKSFNSQTKKENS